MLYCQGELLSHIAPPGTSPFATWTLIASLTALSTSLLIAVFSVEGGWTTRHKLSYTRRVAFDQAVVLLVGAVVAALAEGLLPALDSCSFDDLFMRDDLFSFAGLGTSVYSLLITMSRAAHFAFPLILAFV